MPPEFGHLSEAPRQGQALRGRGGPSGCVCAEVTTCSAELSRWECELHPHRELEPRKLHRFLVLPARLAVPSLGTPPPLP